MAVSRQIEFVPPRDAVGRKRDAGSNGAYEVNKLLDQLKLGYQALPREALFLASKAFIQYPRRGGTKPSPLPDFFIGAHAEVLGIAILTRDQGR